MTEFPSVRSFLMEQQLLPPEVLSHRATRDTQGLPTAASPNARDGVRVVTREAAAHGKGRSLWGSVIFAWPLRAKCGFGVGVRVGPNGMDCLCSRPALTVLLRCSQCPRKVYCSSCGSGVDDRTETLRQRDVPKVRAGRAGIPTQRQAPKSGSIYLNLLTPAPSLTLDPAVCLSPQPPLCHGLLLPGPHPYLRVPGFRPGR